MTYKDLQHFIMALENKKQLKRISAPVSAHLEITEIADRVVKQGGPALLFEHVKQSRYPLLINTFGSYERMGMGLGVKNPEDIGKGIEELIDLSNYSTMLDKIKAIPRLTPLLSVFPIKVKNAACQAVIEKPNLNSLPILQCWPGDGGKFITLPLVFTKDPETGRQNIGMYRMQVYDHKTTGMHWHLHKDGRSIYEKYLKRGLKKMPVSVAIGCDPATIYAATAPLPEMFDEIMLAGYLRKRPVPIVKSVTNNIYIPANSEFVLEGYVNVSEKELRTEGPFGDHTGYYSEADQYPVFHVTKMTRKANPVYMTTIVGKPPMEDCFIGKATERIFLPFLKMIAPEILDINFPLEGVFHNCVIVSIKKKYPMHAKKVMNSIWGMGQMMYTKMVIVVDEKVNPHDISTVAWKVFNNIDPSRDMVISDGPLDALDHASNTKFFGSRLGIDATKKWPSEGYTRDWPDDIEMSREIKELVNVRWKEYGFKKNQK